MKNLCKNNVVTETASGSYYGYTWNSLPQITYTGVLTVNYYDDSEQLLSQSGIPRTQLDYTDKDGFDKRYINSLSGKVCDKGLLVGTRVKFLDGSGEIITTMYYDDRGRVVQTHSTNQLGGYDITYNHYDFSGKVLTTRKENIQGQTVIPEVYAYTYDHGERLINTAYELNNKPAIMLASNSYDELGRLSTKARHTQTDHESYSYNLRSWTTMLKSGTFEEDLYYNTNSLNSNQCFNGNISLSSWTYNGGVMKYGYIYDELNRLTSATTYNVNNQCTNGAFFESFNYDKQGNIKTLARMGSSYPIDNLSLTYNGNQLKKVDDLFSSQNIYSIKEYNNKANQDVEFNYDANGNMTTDLDRKIATIQYNILNLPDLIQFSNGNQIINLYAADGRKLGTEYFTRVTDLAVPLKATEVINQIYTANFINQNGTVYIDNKEYNTWNGNPALTALKRIYNAEGFAEDITLLVPNYYYYRKDHLGNNREVWCANTNAPVQRTQYYPSGLPWASNPGDNPGLQARKYNGKEFVEMNGYDTYVYGAREYYAASGRFMTVDPLAERAYDISPYVYCHNNPVNRIDPDGRIDMDKQTQKKYPKLTAYVKGLAKEWNGKSSEFKKAFMEKSGLNEKQAKEMLIFGKGPKLDVVKNLKDKNGNPANGLTSGSVDLKTGKYSNDNGGNGSFKLDKGAVDMLENAKTNDDKASGKIMVESTAFHEMTHIGNLKVNGNGNGSYNESGQAFEIDAYGQEIETFNVEKYWRSRQPIEPITPPAIPLLDVK